MARQLCLRDPLRGPAGAGARPRARLLLAGPLLLGGPRSPSQAALLRRALLAALVVVAGSGCAIETRSEQYRCGTSGECAADRVCRSGWCVVAGSGGGADGGDGGGGSGSGSARDAGPLRDASGPPDASACPVACTRCDQGGCVIECLADDSCAEQIVCPLGLPCTVICDGAGACQAGIDCSAGASCDVTCSGRQACGGQVRCGPGPCSVGCTALDTCPAGIDCTASCTCETSCSGVRACQAAPACPPGCSDGLDCVSSDSNPACDRCSPTWR